MFLRKNILYMIVSAYLASFSQKNILASKKLQISSIVTFFSCCYNKSNKILFLLLFDFIESKVCKCFWMKIVTTHLSFFKYKFLYSAICAVCMCFCPFLFKWVTLILMRVRFTTLLLILIFDINRGLNLIVVDVCKIY